MQLDMVIPDEAKTMTVITVAQLLKLLHKEAHKEGKRRGKKTVGIGKLFVKCWQKNNHHYHQTHMHSHKDGRYTAIPVGRHRHGANSQLLLVSNQKVSSNNNKTKIILWSNSIFLDAKLFIPPQSTIQQQGGWSASCKLSGLMVRHKTSLG